MGKGRKGSSKGGNTVSPPRPTIEDVPEASESSPSEVSQSVEDWPSEDGSFDDDEVGSPIHRTLQD